MSTQQLTHNDPNHWAAVNDVYLRTRAACGSGATVR